MSINRDPLNDQRGFAAAHAVNDMRPKDKYVPILK